MQYKIDLIFSLRTCKIDIRFTYGKKKNNLQIQVNVLNVYILILIYCLI